MALAERALLPPSQLTFTSHLGKRFYRILAVYQMIGGALGVVFMVWLSATSPDALPWGNVVFAITPFALLMTAGVQLLRKAAQGWHLSVISQLMQVAYWSLGGMVWRFTAGLFIAVGVEGDKSKAFAGLDFALLVGSGATGQQRGFGMNLVALALLVGLVWTRFRNGSDRKARRGGA